MLLQFINVPFSCSAQTCSHILGAQGKQPEEKLLASGCSLSCMQTSEIHGLGRLGLRTLALQTWLSATDPRQACKRLSVHRLTLIHHQRWATPLLQCHSQLASQRAPIKATISCAAQSQSCCGVGTPFTPVQNPCEPNLCDTTQPHRFQVVPQ